MSARYFKSKLRHWGVSRYPRGTFSVYLTGWFFLTNNAYPGEHRYWVRVGRWRKAFGPLSAARSTHRLLSRRQPHDRHPD